MSKRVVGKILQEERLQPVSLHVRLRSGETVRSMTFTGEDDIRAAHQVAATLGDDLDKVTLREIGGSSIVIRGSEIVYMRLVERLTFKDDEREF